MERELRITGEGRLSLTPDIVIIRLPVEATAEDYSGTIDFLNQKVNIVHNILTKNNIEKSKLKTTNFDIRENWEYYKDKRMKPKLLGYIASHDLKLEIPLNNELISSVLTDLSKSNTGISFTLSFDVSEKEQYNKALIKNAVLDAKESAEVLATASGIKLKEIVKIDYSFSEIHFHNDNILYESDMVWAETTMPDFSPDEVKAQKNITIIWRIE